MLRAKGKRLKCASRRRTKAKKVLPKRSEPKEWTEVLPEVRRKQNAFGQDWKYTVRGMKPTRSATLFGSVLYWTDFDRQASTGFWPLRKRVRCIGDGEESEENRGPFYEERWLKEVFIERKLKELCQRSGDHVDDVFRHYDADNSGELDLDEFHTMLAAIGDDLNKHEISWLVRELSRGQKRVSYEEFKAFVTRPNRVGISCTVEWRRGARDNDTTADDFYKSLRKLYDPKMLAPRFHPLYTLPALARRDALKFDPAVRKSLNLLWKKIDLDKSGRIEEDEYILMHEKICHVMADLGKLEEHVAPGGLLDLDEQKKLAIEDWCVDNQGFGFVDYTRFVSCWFQIADQFTDSITAEEYDAFLRKIMSNLFPNDEACGLTKSTACDWQPSSLPIESLALENEIGNDNALSKAADVAERVGAAAAAVAAAASANSGVLLPKLTASVAEFKARERDRVVEDRQREKMLLEKLNADKAAKAASAAAMARKIAEEAEADRARDAVEAEAAARSAFELLGKLEIERNQKILIEQDRRAFLERRRASLMIQRLTRGILTREIYHTVPPAPAQASAYYHDGEEDDERGPARDDDVVEASAQPVGPSAAENQFEEENYWRNKARRMREDAARRTIFYNVFTRLIEPLRQKRAAQLMLLANGNGKERASKFVGGTWSDDEEDDEDNRRRAPPSSRGLKKTSWKYSGGRSSGSSSVRRVFPVVKESERSSNKQRRRLTPCIYCKARVICVCRSSRYKVGECRKAGIPWWVRSENVGLPALVSNRDEKNMARAIE